MEAMQHVRSGKCVSLRVSHFDFAVVSVASKIGSGCALPELITEAMIQNKGATKRSGITH